VLTTQAGRYYEKIITDVEGFKKWWTTTAKLFATNDKVVFDTNNEYHDMDQTLVQRLNQAAIDGIRAAGATTQYILVEGNSWSGAWTWVCDCHPIPSLPPPPLSPFPPFPPRQRLTPLPTQTSSGNGASLKDLKDPSNKIIYEMHQYLDTDGSGTNANCVSSTIGVERIRDATAWLKANGKKGILGETAGGANAQCIAALTGMLKYMQDNSDVWTGWLWWAGGPWWAGKTTFWLMIAVLKSRMRLTGFVADYMFSIEPPSGTAFTKVLPSLTPFI